MSDNQTMGFGKFVPGFDFLQNLAKGASQSMPQMPQLASWVAPTLNVEELERRIGELKAVHFWLDQNSKALGATIQALEVQKMTLATLKGMNLNMAELANAMKLNAGSMMGGLSAAAASAPSRSGNGADTEAEADAGSAKTAARPKPRRAATKQEDAAPAASVVDPMQWWSSLTQQFQQIAATAMKDVAAQSAMDSAKNMAAGVAKEAMKTASGMASRMTAGMPASTPQAGTNTGTGAGEGARASKGAGKRASTPGTAGSQRARKAPVKRAKKGGA